MQLAPGVRVASYQYGPDDSVFVVADGDHVLVDINDSKLRGRTLERILDEFGRPTFVFKSYSFAQSYPVLYTADDPADLELITRDTYLDDWVRVVDAARAALRRPVRQHGGVPPSRQPRCNEHLIPPGEVVDAFRAAASRLAVTEAVQMDPGDSLELGHRLRASGVDWYADRESDLEELAAQVAPKIADQTAEEAGDHARLRDVRRLLPRLHARVPAGRARPLVLHAPGGVRGAVVAAAVLGARLLAACRLPAVVAAARHRQHRDASTKRCSPTRSTKRLVHVVHGSMRIDVHLRPGGAGDDLMFWGLLVPWELGYVPFRACSGPASRRWPGDVVPRRSSCSARPEAVGSRCPTASSG